MQSAQGESALGLGFIRVLSGLSERRKRAQKRVILVEVQLLRKHSSCLFPR